MKTIQASIQIITAFIFLSMLKQGKLNKYGLKGRQSLSGDLIHFPDKINENVDFSFWGIDSRPDVYFGIDGECADSFYLFV